MRSVREKADTLPAPTAHPAERSCSAFGCPEIGSISHSNAGQAPPDSWFCRHHFGEPADRWPEITRRLRTARASAPFPDHPPRVEVTPEYIAGVRAELGRFARSFGKA